LTLRHYEARGHGRPLHRPHRHVSLPQGIHSCDFRADLPVDASSAFAALVAKNPNGAALATLPDIAPLAGGVAIKARDEIVGALGVSGSPGGDKDETCAHSGVASIKDDVASSR
jgi:hypothetical protein